MSLLLSVIMTVHNGSSYLYDAITSVLEQSYHDFELVVVDNGSTDNSLQILNSFNDPRLRVIELGRNIGRTPALNVALEASYGDYVAVQDADDISLPQRLECQISYLRDNADVILLATSFSNIDASGKIMREHRVPTSNETITWNLVFDNCLPHSSVMMRRERIWALGGYDEDFRWAQDYELYSRLMHRKERIAALPETLVYIRLHPQSETYVAEIKSKLEPAKTSCANFRHFLPDLPEKTLKLANAILRKDRYPQTAKEALVAISVLEQLFESFVRQNSPTSKELARLEGNMAARLCQLAIAWRKGFPRVAWYTYRRSFSWDPSHGAIPLTQLGNTLVRKVRRSISLSVAHRKRESASLEGTCNLPPED